MLRIMDAKKGGRKPTMIDVNPTTKRGFQRSLFDVDHLSCGGKPANQSNVTSALWMFFSSMDEKEAEAFLAEWFPRLEEVLRRESRGGEKGPNGGESGPEVTPPEGGISHGDLPTPKAKAPRKKKAR